MYLKNTGVAFPKKKKKKKKKIKKKEKKESRTRWQGNQGLVWNFAN